MSSHAVEQARRMPFSSPMAGRTAATSSTSSTSSPRSHKLPENKHTKAMKETSQDLQKVRSGIPSLNLITKFPTMLHSKAKESKLSIRERRQHSRKISDTATIMNPQSALSASDGTLLIGICLPSDHYEEQKSIAPKIIISPASLLEDPLKGKNWRPRSSIYSQATRISRVRANVVDIPPLPKLPKQSTPLERARPLSATSWHTDFDEDIEREDVCRRYSGESQLGIFRNISVHTTRRASDGWWNTLVSPIFGRSNTFNKRAVPPLPSHVQKEEANPENLLKVSPMPDQRDKARRSSIWTDLSRLDAQRQTLPFFDDSPSDPRTTSKTINERELTPEVIQESGFGLASEYYEATWHDAYSATPFFKCQGHDCAQKIAYRHGRTVGGPDAVYELDGLTEKNLANLSAQSTSAQRSVPDVGIFKTIDTNGLGSARPLHLRKGSDGTEIDDEPDAQSECQGAGRNLSSHDTPSMLELQKPSKDYEISPTPDSVPRRKVETSAASPVSSPAKALRIMGLERGAATPDPVAGKIVQRLERIEPTSSPQRKNRNVLRKVPPVVALEDPFKDPDHDISPGVFTPAFQDEFNRQNAIPMEKQVSQKVTTIASQHDPLNISAPRKAPSPPRVGSIDPTHDLYKADRDTDPRVPMYGLPGTRPVHQEISSHTDYFATSDNMSIDKDRRLEQMPPLFAPPPRQPVDLGEDEKKKNNVKAKGEGCSIFGCLKRHPGKQTQTRKKWYIIIGAALLSMVILILVLVLVLTLHRSDAPAQSSMLTVPGFPPIPTGISTIAQPNAAIEESRCVAPNTLWSCAVPKEQQSLIAPNAPDQPNFRVEIRFQNGSAASRASRNIKHHSITNAVGAGSFIRRRTLRARDSFTSSLFSPSPAPPSQDDQTFLGKTTDNNTTPFQGEATPFYISLLSTTSTGSKRPVVIRDNTNPFPNVTALIPPPSTNPDGTAAAANLVPFPSAQPLMLYNRGRSDEHYGFYTYFDRSIFLKSTDLLNSTGPDIPDNANGGSTESAADVRCTWAQTRFLVQIWTNSGNALQLLNSSNSSKSPIANSATNFVQPGSFPYPVSLTLDRHGGDVNQKMIYCYGMDLQSRIVSTEKQVHLELRSFGGPGLINPGGGLFSGPVNVSLTNGGPGGIDGGFGGCKCQWRNWIQI